MVAARIHAFAWSSHGTVPVPARIAASSQGAFTELWMRSLTISF